MGHINDVGHIYQQAIIYVCSEIGFAKLYDRRDAPAADMLWLMRMFTDGEIECCENRERREYELYPAVEGTDRSKIKAGSPQRNSICGRFDSTAGNGFHAAAFGRKSTPPNGGCKSVLMRGRPPATRKGHVLGSVVPKRHLYRLSLRGRLWQGSISCKIRKQRRESQPTVGVREAAQLRDRLPDGFLSD